MNNMTNNTSTSIMSMLDAMSVEELKNRLAAYMMADENVTPQPIGVEVRLSENLSSNRYMVLLVMQDGSELEVKFRDRYSRLVYIYTLLHPQGYQRRALENNDYQPLRQLYSKLYFASADRMLKSIDRLTFGQFFNQAVSQARSSIRNVTGRQTDFDIALPQRNGGRTVINHAKNGGYVIIDSSLL